jgi:hypothetical protein
MPAGEGLPDKPAQAKGFGLLSLCWGVGSLSGPMIGGSLSAPCSTALRVEALCGEGSLLVHRCAAAATEARYPPCSPA